MAPAERLAQIINVSKSLFSDQGFNGTTTKDIAHATRKATHDEVIRSFLSIVLNGSRNELLPVM
mgnify:CR=1 FL=1